ncbi:hypothetical protein [Leyella stercorea]|uniref:hypothetical protein n=1 Tax=Leyella stercorea TaxID=363265 RepID=UPI0026DBD999|nr:hypothetical protein [Leyella stercorea]
MEAFFRISLPKDWLSLSDSQLLFFFRLLSHDLQIEEVLTVCLFKWADLRLLCRTANDSFLVKRATDRSRKPRLPSCRFSLPQQPSAT